MEKSIIMGSRKVTLRASAGALVVYKDQFGSEYTEDIEALKENPENALTVGCQLIWSMAKVADDRTEPPIDFFENIGEFDTEKAFAEATDLFDRSCRNINSAGENGKDKLTSENLVTSALICKMSFSDLCRLPLSMAINIIGEYCALKSGEEPTRWATQEDFDNF
jgi:hypothetical protein